MNYWCIAYRLEPLDAGNNAIGTTCYVLRGGGGQLVMPMDRTISFVELYDESHHGIIIEQKEGKEQNDYIEIVTTFSPVDL